MADILSQAGDLTGISGPGGGFDITMVITFFMIAIILMVLSGLGTYFLIRWYQYKYKIRIYQRINGQFQETVVRRARVIQVGKGGDEALFLNKPKKILPMPSIQSGKNTFLFFVSDDGEWINFRHGDFDDDRREVGAMFLDKEMRYARTSLQHMGEERYDTKGFWEKYGGMVAYASLILVTMIGLWLIIDKMVDFQATSNAVMSTTNEVLDKLNGVLGSADNIQSGGSGLTPAT